MKKIIALLFILLIASAAFAQNSMWFKGTLDEAFAKANADHKPLLVDFYSYT